MTAAFHSLLQQNARKRIPLDEVRRVFFAARPELVANPSRNTQLLEALRTLEQANLIRLPAPGNSWEKLGNPPLPNWIQLVSETPVADQEDPAGIAWVPELGFWTELKSSTLDAAKAINTFLLRRRGAFRMVPIKERSLEIFGDEKRLDTMRTGDTLFSGRLSLSTIGAFQVQEPLPYRQSDAPGKPLLVLENHNSFWSFGEWNHTARRYSAVVFGSGNEFNTKSRGLALGQVLHEVDGIGAEYLGDLDPAGVSIPMAFNRVMVSDGISVTPALDFYRWLLSNGRRRKRIDERDFVGTLANDWLGTELGAGLSELWASGYWIPQEGLGFEALQGFETNTINI